MTTNKIKTTWEEDEQWAAQVQDDIIAVIIKVDNKRKEIKDRECDVTLMRMTDALRKFNELSDHWVGVREDIRDSNALVH